MLKYEFCKKRNLTTANKTESTLHRFNPMTATSLQLLLSSVPKGVVVEVRVS